MSKISSANGHKKGIARNCLKENTYSAPVRRFGDVNLLWSGTKSKEEADEAAWPQVVPQQPNHYITYRYCNLLWRGTKNRGGGGSR